MEQQVNNKILKVETDKYNCKYIFFEKGKIIQGGVEIGPIKDFYSKIMQQDQETNYILVNCAKRVGQDKIQEIPQNKNKIYWLSMTEEQKIQQSQQYIQKYGDQILQYLGEGYTVVVNCHHGLHRSVEFTKQLIKYSGNGDVQIQFG